MNVEPPVEPAATAELKAFSREDLFASPEDDDTDVGSCDDDEPNGGAGDQSSPITAIEATIERTGDASVPWVAMIGDHVSIAESLVCCRWAKNNEITFLTALRAALTDLMKTPGYFLADGRCVIASGDTYVARSFVEAVVHQYGGRLKPLKGRPGFSVRVKARFRRRLSLAFITMSALINTMKDLGLFMGQNPILLGACDDLTEEQIAAIKVNSAKAPHNQNRFTSDTGRFYRFAFKMWIPTRTSDVRWYEKLMAVVRKACRLAAVEIYIELVGVMGCRPGEPQWLTFGAWWGKFKGFTARMMLRNKGDDGDPEKPGIANARVLAMLVNYVNGLRRKHDPKHRGIAEFTELGRLADAGDLAAQAELDRTPVLLNGEGRRLTYDVVWYHLKTIIDRREMPISLHWLRHEYVFGRMRAIEKVKDDAQREQDIDDLCAYMGWSSGRAMLACYDAFQRSIRIDVKTLEWAETRDAKSEQIATDPANDVAPPRFIAPLLAEMLELANAE